MEFLPISKEDMARRGWREADFVLVTGDAYVDHPSFGTAIISRVLERAGYKIAILPQPDITGSHCMEALGTPRLGFIVNAGNIDSMVAHYTAAKRKRRSDSYSPGNKAGKRPDRAVIRYCEAIRKSYPRIPIVIGGLEASLRRFAHYDYWDDNVRPSILVDAGADILSYGMGERSMVELARWMEAGCGPGALQAICGICYLSDDPGIKKSIRLPSFEKVAADKTDYANACRMEQEEQDPVTGRTLIQAHGGRYLIQTPPALPLNGKELDQVYELPYMGYYHPVYEKEGGVPAIEEVEFSIIHNRGCFGACNFCSLSFHQGRQVTVRSKESVVREAEKLIKNPRFKGYIHDVGGPTANFRRPSCEKQLKNGFCKNKKCLAPVPCNNIRADHREYLDILKALRELPGVKKVFIRSGLRYDYLLLDDNPRFLHELVRHHVSGQLKVAPEHCSAHVLERMGKPPIKAYREFQRRFYSATEKAGKKQYLVPYLMSSHPGSTLPDAVELAVFLKKEGIRPEQVQDFYPTPGTVSTCMFYTGLDPFTMKQVYVPKTQSEKDLQRALLQYYKPENRRKVLDALRKTGRGDLIGYGRECLLAPVGGQDKKERSHRQKQISGNRGYGGKRGKKKK